MRGFIAWQGPSPVTGDPTVLVITGPSLNTKTGPMYQAWLLVRDATPFDALKSGADRAICGDCVHRSQDRRTCYVSMFNGPRAVWQGVNRGVYPIVTPEEGGRRLAGHQVRVTAYGDPAFVPFDVWMDLLVEAAGWAAYTHQWRTCDPRFQLFCMASVESPTEALEAQARGWRTFRARAADAPVMKGEFVCPASDEAGHRTTCARCQLCRGAGSPAKSVTIQLHGRGAAARSGGPRSKYDELRAALERDGQGRISLTGPERVRAVLALRQYYLRHDRRVDVHSRRDGDGVYRFWLETPRATREERSR